MPKIASIFSYKVVNSRGDWTLRTKVALDDGSYGVETVPEGASKGQHEAVYIPTDQAVDVVNKKIAKVLVGRDPFDQQAIDALLLKLDGTYNKSNLGGNSLLSVSLAVAKACANSYKIELYQYLNKLYNCVDGVCVPSQLLKGKIKFPTPMFNVLNGGKHAHNGLSFQEFMIIPAATMPFDKAYTLGVEVYQSLKQKLVESGADVDVGDEGGFAPNNFNPHKALKVLKEALGPKLKPGRDVFFGIDVAAESFYSAGTNSAGTNRNNAYHIDESGLSLTSVELLNYYKDLVAQYELIYLEDPFYEQDYEAWIRVNKALGSKLLVSGDDLVVTNAKILENAIKHEYCNTVIVKPNQVGTLSETFDFIRLAQARKLAVVISHRSGDTAEDTFIADLAVAVGADFIKSGAPARGERVAKYNRLLEIFQLNA